VARRCGGLIAAGIVALATCGGASAEVFLLTGGGRLEGEILNPDQLPRKTYTIRTSLGVEIMLPAAEVKKVLRPRPEEIEYEKTRARYPDTVEGQWELAEWCRQRRLFTRRKTHLQRVIELDPDHVQARRALGYTQVGSEWKTQEQRMLEQGYVRYKGRWLLPQQVELIERERQEDLAEGEWKQKLKLWRDWLGTEKTRVAERNILEIDDPFAVKALADGLEDDGRDQARLLFVRALARIGTPAAMRVLALQAMSDPVEEVRLTCLDYLKAKNDPGAVTYFIGRLQSKSNAEVRWAARALRHMGDPSAIGPLIEALITTHKEKIPARNPGQISTTFSSAGGSGLTMGGGPTIITRRISNREVLDALVTLTGGANFSFDVPKWKSWYTSQKSRPDLDARRD